MARAIPYRDIAAILDAAKLWIDKCLVKDGSILSDGELWMVASVQEAQDAFVGRRDHGDDDFITKLVGQMRDASAPAQRLMAEMLWALLLFPSNVTPARKREQIRSVWALGGEELPTQSPMLRDEVLVGIGSGGPGFNNYRPAELAYLIGLVRDIKARSVGERRRIFDDYHTFVKWIDAIPREGLRQFRHMLRYFAFPDLVERMSSNNDRYKILEAFGVARQKESRGWTDKPLDEALLALRKKLELDRPNDVIDFYEPSLKQIWAPERIVRTTEGEIAIVVPDDEETDGGDTTVAEAPAARQSFQIQATLAEIGRAMGFQIWLPRADRSRVRDLIREADDKTFIDDLPLSYDRATLDTIEQIDVLWLRRRSIVRAFEVEHSTAVYSGLLRMADLLALQPNMDIRLHIVAPEERREKVFREMRRPVFSLLERGPLVGSCTFLSYDSVMAIRRIPTLAHTSDSVIDDYQERSVSS